MVVVLHKEQVAEGRLGLSWCQDVAKLEVLYTAALS